MGHNPQVCAIILAAGRASRMGQVKQLLRLGNKTILEHVVHRTLQEDFAEIYTVIGHEALQIQQTILVDDSHFNWLVNENYLAGQSSSLKLAIQQINKKYNHIIVFLGDLPFIKRETIRAVYEAGVKLINENEEPFVIRPTYEGNLGHPVFMGNISQSLFMEMTGDSGAISIMNKIKCKKKIEVEDRGVILDIDTPRDYKYALDILEE